MVSLHKFCNSSRSGSQIVRATVFGSVTVGDELGAGEIEGVADGSVETDGSKETDGSSDGSMDSLGLSLGSSDKVGICDGSMLSLGPSVLGVDEGFGEGKGCVGDMVGESVGY